MGGGGGGRYRSVAPVIAISKPALISFYSVTTDVAISPLSTLLSDGSDK